MVNLLGILVGFLDLWFRVLWVRLLVLVCLVVVMSLVIEVMILVLVELRLVLRDINFGVMRGVFISFFYRWVRLM